MSANPKEQQLLVSKIEANVVFLQRACSLPPAVGDRIRWDHNGLAWERAADNSWVPVDPEFGPARNESYPTSHIVLFGFTVETYNLVAVIS